VHQLDGDDLAVALAEDHESTATDGSF
jgi:hypothetical protein